MIYSQRDPRWANQRLGTMNGATIGQYGCFVTSAAMVLTHYGHTINPAELDDLLTNKGLYAQQDLYVDSSIQTLFPDVKLESVYHCENIPCDLSKLSMNEQEEIILVLDFDHNPNDGIQIHACRVYDYRNGVITLDDPWYGTRDNFTVHYGDNPKQTIQQVIKYIKPDYHVVVDPCADLRAQLIATQSSFDAYKAHVADWVQQYTDYKAAVAAWVQTFPK